MHRRWMFLVARFALLGGLTQTLAACAEGGTAAKSGPPVIQVLKQEEKAEFGTQPFSARVKFIEDGEWKGLKQEVSLKGRTLAIEGLGTMIYDARKDRLISYGQPLHYHMAGRSFSYQVYSPEGQRLLELDKVVLGPYAASVERDGSFAVVGKSSDEAHPTWFVAQYDSEARLKWKTALPEPRHPHDIAHTQDLGAVGVVSSSLASAARDGQLSIYDGTGTLRYTQPVSAATELAFVQGGKVVLCDTTRWDLLDMKQGFKKVTSGGFAGRSLGGSPAVAHPTQELFVIVSMTEGASKTELVLQAFRGKDGSLLAERRFQPKALYWEPERMRFDEEGTLRLDVDKQVFTLRLPNP